MGKTRSKKPDKKRGPPVKLTDPHLGSDNISDHPPLTKSKPMSPREVPGIDNLNGKHSKCFEDRFNDFLNTVSAVSKLLMILKDVFTTLKIERNDTWDGLSWVLSMTWLIRMVVQKWIKMNRK